MKRKLPIGIQTFRTVREEGFYYVDKTMYARRLVDEGTHYFLSRPRRFGKSLFVDTLKELFEGNEPLFEGAGRPRSMGLVGTPSRHAPRLQRTELYRTRPSRHEPGGSTRRHGAARGHQYLVPRRPGNGSPI